MLPLWAYRLLPFLGRWTESAPAACCGVCRTCVTNTAAGVGAAATALALEAVGLREHRGDGEGPPPERADEPIELPVYRSG